MRSAALICVTTLVLMSVKPKSAALSESFYSQFLLTLCFCLINLALPYLQTNASSLSEDRACATSIHSIFALSVVV